MEFRCSHIENPISVVVTAARPGVGPIEDRQYTRNETAAERSSGRKEDPQEDLAGNATPGADGCRDDGGVRQVGEMSKMPADLLKTRVDSSLGPSCHKLGVTPNGEVMDAMVPLLCGRGIRTPSGDMGILSMAGGVVFFRLEAVKRANNTM